MSKDSHFTGQPVYSQVLKLLDKEKILQISRETKGSEAYVKRFDGYQHLVVMLFGILKHFDSLRELEIGMKAEAHKLGHLGMNYLVRRSTLAEANIRRPQEFFASVYAYLLDKYAKFLADSRPAKSYKGQTHEPKDWETLLYMMDSNIERWYSMKEICEYLGVSRDTVLAWIEKRNMPAAKIGRLWKFKVSEVDAWMKSGVAADN